MKFSDPLANFRECIIKEFPTKRISYSGESELKIYDMSLDEIKRLYEKCATPSGYK